MTDPLDQPTERGITALDHLAAWQRDATHERKHGGYATGIPTIDHALERPIRAGELIIVGARPGVGKSYFLGHIGRHNLLRNPRTRVGMMSLEMPGSDVFEREAAIALNIAPRDLRRWVSEPDAPDATLITSDHPYLLRLLVDEERRSFDQLVPAIRAMGNPPIVLIDYLGLIEHPDPRTREYEAVSAAVLATKLAAKECGVAIFLAAQLRRRDDGSVARSDDTIAPRMSDLKSSGHIEAHADRILGLWRDERDRRIVYVNILKNRHGAGTGTVATLNQSTSGALREQE